MQNLEQILYVSTTVLGQAIDLLENSLVSDEQLTVQSKYLPGSTIGKHLRHARDHFAILLDCITSPAPHIMSYDKRSRNTPMESNRQAAKEAIQETMDRLKEVVPKSRLDEPLTLNAITPYEQTFQSTFGREVWFGALHAVHHWSMVRVIAGELNITLEDSFGYAPSTLVYKGSSDAPLGKAKI
ncbi:uncharacterized protein STEHIDRAFT_47161 [Stereum hirsutum FP-91666 SS1]|uniref:uncharacterized protein n=1 Tax=Stereum hirsutum (strain FP-91666) TaxID=721885 RepID=UPI000440F0DD|nr:uncharacterized protein STEHIDRAFT_47161 [Stereum hirsutum FP-91666 SS1]EIM92808.1 hypothetical protein STEHIDRAFT_47161 [Stereum hirsutum FP-91666 SS1]